jgi:hypothetical protein
MMSLRTSSFLLSSSILLVGVVNGRRLFDQRMLEKDLFVLIDETQPNLFESEEKHQSTTTNSDSGTRQLAEDLDRFRVLIEAPALSIYGISYGTTVMGKILENNTLSILSFRQILSYMFLLFTYISILDQPHMPLFSQVMWINSSLMAVCKYPLSMQEINDYKI